jgi:hypothetical protein
VIQFPNGVPFATGSASYSDDDPESPQGKSAIYLQIVLPISGGVSFFAAVDTGAPYCIFDREILQQLGCPFEDSNLIQLKTHRGEFAGNLQRVSVRLPAEDGDTLEIDATVFVSSEWIHGNFLGYSGFLQRFRFAVDPTVNAFYFGRCE